MAVGFGSRWPTGMATPDFDCDCDSDCDCDADCDCDTDCDADTDSDTDDDDDTDKTGVRREERPDLRTTVILLAIVCGVFWMAGSIDVPAQPRPRYDFQPGQLALPLTVAERSLVSRAGAVVTSGVPFPPGFLSDPTRLAVLDPSGRPVPTQVSVMSRWWKPAYDDSVRWARVSFPADVASGRFARYTLVDRPLTEKEKAGLSGLEATVSETGDALVVSTGVARFTLPRSGSPLLARAEVGGADLLGPDGVKVLLIGGDWPEEGMVRGGIHFGIHDRVEVEERGPVRVVVAVYGTFRGKGPGTFQGGDLYDFTARLYFEAGSARVRLVHTIRNGRLGPTLHVWPVEDLSLFAQLAIGDAPKVSLLGQNEPVTVDLSRVKVASLYQDSSGGPEWKELTHLKNYASWLSYFTKTPKDARNEKDAHYTVKGASFRGYEIRADEKVLEQGALGRGVAEVSGSKGALLVAMRHFRERCPAGLAVIGSAFRAALWPAEYADVLFLEPGQRFTRELTLDFRLTPGSAEDLKHAYRVLDRRLLFLAPTSWYVQTGAWDAGLADMRRLGPGQTGSGAATSRAGLNKDQLDGVDVGWDWFGWIKGWNAGGAHWNQTTCFAPFLLWEDRESYDVAEARTLWASDATPMHFDRCDLGRYWMVLRGWKFEDCGIQRKRFPEREAAYDWRGRAVWGNPDDGHMGMFMWFEYYNLTGDRRVLESCLALGERARAYMWSFNHDDVRRGGAGGGSVPWCRRRDPDDPGFRLHNRYIGWPAYNMALYYQLTGDPQVARETGNIVAGLRNTLRWSPPGFLTTEILKPGSTDGYGGQLATGPPPTDSASQCYANFQAGVCATAMAQYYHETRDEEALDGLIGFADFYCHHALIRDEEGRAHGWPYVTGDYWGPYRLKDFPGPWRPNWMNQNFRVVQPLGFIYLLTGRDDYRAVLETALRGREGPQVRVMAAVQALARAREDRVPPAAVTDLRAEALGGGRVRLTWTAPGDDGNKGTAARYQVKRSTSPIVERISGWPDRTPPLPQDAAEWEARARAFNARQRAFWSTRNCRDEPLPEKAGSTQTYETGGLTPGVWYFALKTWDDGPNMSALSNVVRVEVSDRRETTRIGRAAGLVAYAFRHDFATGIPGRASTRAERSLQRADDHVDPSGKLIRS